MASTIHHDEQVPERTTPQGTQEGGVEHGHEATDASLPQIGGWFLGLALTCIISQILIWATFQWWVSTAANKDRLPSPFFAQRQVPPPPRIQPNPIDYPENQMTNPRADAPDYPETLPGERQREDQQLQRLGLQDQATGLPRLPEQAVATVIARSRGGGAAGQPLPGAAGNEALEQLRPSFASGGTALENQLR